MLTPVRWRRVTSWVCGWLFLVGNITITLAVCFGSSSFIIACINVFQTEPDRPVLSGVPYQVFLIFFAIILLSNLVTTFGNRWLPWIDVSIQTI